MKALVYHGRHDLRLEERPRPEPGPGELLLEVHSVGVCGTDAAEWEHGPGIYAIDGVHKVTGHSGPLVPGHELSGRVVGLGAGVEGFAQNAVVACGAGYTVDEDTETARGRPNLSAHYATIGLQRDGGLAQYVVVPAETCLDVGSYGLADDGAALAQPMAIAVHAMRRGRLQPDEQALVIGAGGIGAFLLYAAVELGARVAVADLSAERLAIAQAMGAGTLLDLSDGRSLGEHLDAHGIRPDVIYEVSGSGPGLAGAIAAAPNGSRLVLVGLHERPREIDVRRVTLGEIDLLGTSAHVCAVDLPEAVRILATRQDWSDVAPQAFPLAQVVDEGILPIVERRATRIKTLIDPWADAPRTTDTAPRR